MKKLESRSVEARLPPKEKALIVFIGNNLGCKLGEISKKLGISNPTTKKILTDLVNKVLLARYGTGPGTHCSIE